MEHQFVKPPQVFLEAMPASTLRNSIQSVIHNDIFRFAYPTGSSILLISSEKLPPIPIDADEFNLDSERFYLPSGDLALITTNVGINLGALADDAASVLQAQAVSMLGTSDVDVFDISQLDSWQSQVLKNWNLINTSDIDTLLSTVELVDGKEGIDTIKIDRDYASGDFKLERVDESTFVITAPKYSYNPMTVKNVEQIEFNDTGVTTVEALLGIFTVDIILELSGEVRMLKGLTEINNGEIHVVIYEGEIFDYAEIDPAITAVIRDGVFTDEFAQEIAEIAPAHAGISYEAVVGIVGVAAIDDFLISVAGADGNYVA